MEERKSNFDIHFTPIATELGRLVYAWNELHEHLGHLFDLVVSPKGPRGTALAAWRAVENDRTQRTMLRYAVEHAASRLDKALVGEILWVLERANSLAEHRNNAIHSPYAIVTTQGKTEILPLDFFGNPRARKLGGKHLVSEFQWCYACSQTLSGYAIRLVAILDTGSALPERPKLPDRLPKQKS